jgi:CelD/BcsL family acetyltransferase involved in cellulose biosynthesis
LPASEISLPLRIGARTLVTLRRRLVRRGLSLKEALEGGAPTLPALAPGEHGYLVTALPAAALGALRARHAGLRPFVRQSYRRSYARLDGDFDAYLGGFSAKSRSTCRRKLKKLAERSGGAVDVRCYRTEEEIGQFHAEARLLSARTYQERLLDAGLPAGAEAAAEMRALARIGRARGWLLFLDGAPIAYLYAPAEGATLIYAHLGHDPDFAEFSPGTVLQLEAMRQLMAEKSFALFDFTEGEGQHKRLFATGGVDCVDLLLLRPTAGNLLAGHGLSGFDRGVALAKKAVTRFGLGRAFKRLRR